ncbi:MAG: PEP-CTERM sorting domain-containing protein [FCB group bacterium]|jgi:hypothetical protein|nr:PEP-CTERM sorting domain-containing protein [FCB group bacterium]
MRYARLVILFGITLAFAIAMPARADIIFGDPNPALVTGDYSDFDFPRQIAGAFVLQPGAAVVTDIHWWGLYAAGDSFADDDFWIRIFADNGAATPEDTPSILELHPVNVLRVDTGLDAADLDIYYYSLDISPLALTAGTPYYLSIVNDTGGDSDNWAWLDAAAGAHWLRGVDVDPWSVGRLLTQPAFTLTNDNTVIPEPATLSLLGIGLGALALRRRLNRKSKI